MLRHNRAKTSVRDRASGTFTHPTSTGFAKGSFHLDGSKAFDGHSHRLYLHLCSAKVAAAEARGSDQTPKRMCKSRSARPEDARVNASGAHAVPRAQADLEGWQGTEVEDERPGLVCQPPRGGVGQGGAGSKGHPRQHKAPLHCKSLHIDI